jgi:hypothetical protein
MMSQSDPDLERLQALQASAAAVTPPVESPTWNFHTLARAGSLFGLLVASWMLLTFLARLLPDFAIVYAILSGAGLLACFYVAIAGHPSLFALVGITAFGVILATLLAGWDLLLGLLYYEGAAVVKATVVGLGFVLSTALVRVFFNTRLQPRSQLDRNRDQKQAAEASASHAYDAAWAAYLDEWNSTQSDPQF